MSDMSEPTYALKFLSAGAIGPYSGFHWPVPNGKPGKWVGAKGDLVACENGIHACTLAQAPAWLKEEAYIIELGGKVQNAGDKLVARRGRLVHRLDSWTERTQRLFAADCAEHVLPIFEKRRPHDDRPRLAIQAARDYADGNIDAAARAAAGYAAGAAARAAADAAAWAAVSAAARAAADAAARAAEGAWQSRRLAHYLRIPKKYLELLERTTDE